MEQEQWTIVPHGTRNQFKVQVKLDDETLEFGPLPNLQQETVERVLAGVEIVKAVEAKVEQKDEVSLRVLTLALPKLVEQYAKSATLNISTAIDALWALLTGGTPAYLQKLANKRPPLGFDDKELLLALVKMSSCWVQVFKSQIEVYALKLDSPDTFKILEDEVEKERPPMVEFRAADAVDKVDNEDNEEGGDE